MSFVDNGSGMYMPVAPAGYGGYGNNGFFGGDGEWIALFLIAAMFGGFGGNWGGNGYGDGAFPWLLTSNNNLSNQMQEGFNSVQTNSQLSDINNAINNGFASMEVANCGRAMDAMQVAYNNQIQDMNQRFSMQQSFDQCCCENRLATANTQALISREAAANRENVTSGVQRILDTICQDKIDAKNEKIAELQNQLNIQAVSNNVDSRIDTLQNQLTQLIQGINAVNGGAFYPYPYANTIA